MGNSNTRHRQTVLMVLFGTIQGRQDSAKQYKTVQNNIRQCKAIDSAKKCKTVQDNCQCQTKTMQDTTGTASNKKQCKTIQMGKQENSTRQLRDIR